MATPQITVNQLYSAPPKEMKYDHKQRDDQNNVNQATDNFFEEQKAEQPDDGGDAHATEPRNVARMNRAANGEARIHPRQVHPRGRQLRYAGETLTSETQHFVEKALEG